MTANVTLAAGGALNVTVNSGTLTIIVNSVDSTSSPGTDSSEPAPQPEGSLAKPSVSSPFPEVDSTVHTGPHNYYAVARSPKAPGLVGVWFVPWTYLEMLLPGQKLCGSSCKLKRFSSLDSAKAWFVKTSNSSVEPKLFP